MSAPRGVLMVTARPFLSRIALNSLIAVGVEGLYLES